MHEARIELNRVRVLTFSSKHEQRSILRNVPTFCTSQNDEFQNKQNEYSNGPSVQISCYYLWHITISDTYY